VTSNVLETLVAASQLGLSIPTRMFEDGVDAMLSHKDKNSPSSLPVFGFWNQKKTFVNNETVYKAYPSNINIPLDLLGKLGDILEAGAGKLGIKGDLRQLIDTANSFSKIGSSIFTIPPDADDTGCALGLGSQIQLLAEQGNKQFKKTAQLFWKGLDPEAQALNLFLAYAYDPLSEDTDENVIDSRTYRWLRPFLHAKSKSVNSLKLVTTWFQRISDIQSEGKYQKMPFNVNNVDGSVAVNALFAMTNLLLNQPTTYGPQFNENVFQLYDDTASLVLYILKNNLIQLHAPSILLYYPSKFAFYYFVSRLAKSLENFDAEKTNLPIAVSSLFIKWGVNFKDAMRLYVTPQLLSLQKSVLSEKKTPFIVYDDFLGNADQHARYDDRVFSTSMAFNTLMNTWTVSNTKRNNLDSKQLVWDKDTPLELLSNLNQTAAYLLSPEASASPLENAFFSASIKSVATLPMFVVTNYRKSLDGSQSLSCNQTLSQKSSYGFTFGVSGLIPEDEYEASALQGCFGRPNQNPDIDYNW
jgi:hypothetical protein